MSLLDVLFDRGVSADSVTTGIAAGDYSELWKEQSATDAQLSDRIRKYLARDDITPLQRQQAEKNLARVTSEPEVYSPITGNGELFANEAAKAGREAINKVASFGFSAVPLWVWILTGLVFLGYIGFLFSPAFKPK